VDRYFGDDAHEAWELAEGLRVGAIKRRLYESHGPYSELRSVGLPTISGERSTAGRPSTGHVTCSPGRKIFDPSKHGSWPRQLPGPQRRSARMMLSPEF